MRDVSILGIVALAFFMSAPPAAAATPLTVAEKSAIDVLVARALSASRAPSASVAIARDGQIVFAKAYGLRRMEPLEPATVDTRYRVASVSKQFTAAAVLMLANEHKVSLDDPLVRYLPELGRGNHATIRQALAHTAGFPEFWSVDYLPSGLKSPTTPQSILQRWGAAAPEFAPGTKWSYSNTGYVVLGLLVEKVSREPLSAFLNQRIFAPLGMTSAADVDGKAPTDRDASGYMRAALGPPRETELAAAGWTFGCGELAMTASDLARWDIGLIEEKALSPAATSAMESETKLSDGSPTGYGLGVFVDRIGVHRRISHNGIIPGFWSENRIYPDDRAAVVVLVNGSYGDPPQVAIADAIEAMLIPPDHSATPRVPPPPSPGRIAGMVFRSIAGGSLDRSRLTADANAYFSPAVLSDYRASFEALGDPLAVIPSEDVTDKGIRTAAWRWIWPSATLAVTLTLDSTGKVSEFIVVPISETGRPPLLGVRSNP